VLTAVASVERDPMRLAALGRHANLILKDGERNLKTDEDVEDLRQRHGNFLAMASWRPMISLFVDR
jgi:uncharacterized membrane protein